MGRWEKLKDKVTVQSKLRNNLAHYSVVGIAGKNGEVFLVPYWTDIDKFFNSFEKEQWDSQKIKALGEGFNSLRWELQEFRLSLGFPDLIPPPATNH